MTVESKTLAIVGMSVDHIEQVMRSANIEPSKIYDVDWLYWELDQFDEDVSEINYGYNTPATHIGICVKESWNQIEITSDLLDLSFTLIDTLNKKYETDKFKLYMGTFTW